MNYNTTSDRRHLYFYSGLFSNSNTDHSKDAEFDIDQKIDDTAGTLSLKMSTTGLQARMRISGQRAERPRGSDETNMIKKNILKTFQVRLCL